MRIGIYDPFLLISIGWLRVEAEREVWQQRNELHSLMSPARGVKGRQIRWCLRPGLLMTVPARLQSVYYPICKHTLALALLRTKGGWAYLSWRHVAEAGGWDLLLLAWNLFVVGAEGSAAGQRLACIVTRTPSDLFGGQCKPRPLGLAVVKQHISHFDRLHEMILR